MGVSGRGQGRDGTLPARGPWPRVILALLVLAAFSNSFPGAFLSDDYPIIVDNPLVAELRWTEILVTDYWGPGVNTNHHRPLTVLSYALNRALFGVGAASHHAVNVLLHAGVTLLLFEVLLAHGVGAAVAWSASALFAVHPIHTETVNIVTGRSELLPALFMLLGLLLARRGGRWMLPAVGTCHAAALLSKESAVVFPLLLLAGDAFAERDFRALLRRRWPLYAQAALVTLAWLGMRQWLLPAASLPSHLSVRALDNPLLDLSPPWRLAAALKVQLLYLGTLLVPLRLHAVYVDTMLGPLAAAGGLGWAAVVLAAGAILGVGVAGWRRREPFSLGLAWYGAAFLLTGNFLVVLPYLMAERFAYTPSAGFCLAAAGLAAVALRTAEHPLRRRIGGALVAAAVLLLGGRTLARNGDFRSPVGLWEAETRSEPSNTRAWLFLADAYRQQQRWGDAERALLTATRLAPGLPEPWAALGALRESTGRLPEARDAFLRALDADFVSQDAVTGFVLTSIRLDRPQDAVALVAWSERLFRDRGWYWDLAGQARAAAGDPSGAAAAYRTALGLPDHPARTARALDDLAATSPGDGDGRHPPQRHEAGAGPVGR